jgi:Holliday junction DNA helicase RuvB
MASNNAILSGEYPDNWDEYIGQDRAKRWLQIAAKSANKRGANMGHVLISSPWAGQGKTALAILTARTLGRTVHVITGTVKLADARIMFSRVKAGDVILWDEFHKAVEGGKANIEWMLHYLENGVLLTKRGPEEVPAVTFIAATTDKGVLPEPVLQRFNVLELDPYTDIQGARIAGGLSDKIMMPAGLPPIDDDTAVAIAAAGSNQPRLMRKLLMSLRDLAICEEIPEPTDGTYVLEEALNFAGLTPDGLTQEAREYLRILYVELGAEPGGAGLMRERMGLVGRGLASVEQLLLDKDLIAKTKAGRELTTAGIRRAMEVVEANEQITVSM